MSTTKTTRLSKHDAMYARIRQHGENLKKVFRLPADTEPIALCKRLRIVEGKARRWAEDLCNGTVEDSDTQREKVVSSTLKALGIDKTKVPIVFNCDPRGYALKIRDDWMAEHKDVTPLYSDWGGYGILAPDLTEG